MSAAERGPAGEVLRRVLEAARAEGALEGERLAEFARALQERAELILAERVTELERELAWRREAMAGLEQRAQGLADENAWRREAMQGLADENAWRREAMQGLADENAWRREALQGLAEENAWRREAMQGLEARSSRLQADLAASRADLEAAAGTERAYRELLSHHHGLLGRLASDLDRAAELSVLRLRALRTLLRQMAEALRQDAR